MNGLDLFSGIGGISLALRNWVRPVAYCEIDRYCQGVLLSRMQSGELSKAPIWDDVRTLKKELLPKIEIIYGGFPCQDISCAGRGIGLVGERSGLYWQIERLIKETNPRFVFLENVPAIRTRGLNAVIQSLTELGYDCRWTIVSAAEVGACHLRKRWFLLAHNHRADIRTQSIKFEKCKKTYESRFNGESRATANSDGPGLEGFWRSKQRITRPVVYDGWKSQPTICRGADGIPHRVDRIRGLGNSVVPMQAKEAFMRLSGMKRLAGGGE